MKEKKKMKTIAKLGIGVGILAILSPIGLIVPGLFRAGSAWGEWSSAELKELIGYVPGGLERLSSIWTAILPDYSFSGWENKGIGNISFAYILSAIVGIALCAGLSFLLGKFLSKNDNDGTHGER